MSNNFKKKFYSHHQFVFTEIGGDSKEGRFGLRNMNALKFLMFGVVGDKIVESTMTSKQIQDLMKSNQKFDLVVGECFLAEALLAGFAYKYNAPLIGFTTFIPNTWGNEMVIEFISIIISFLLF